MDRRATFRLIAMEGGKTDNLTVTVDREIQK